MDPLRATSLLPFVPSGNDYEASRRLFTEIGFEEIWENGGYAGFRSGDGQFILQTFDDRRFAENVMVRINVPDLDAWWQVANLCVPRLQKGLTAFQADPITWD